MQQATIVKCNVHCKEWVGSETFCGELLQTENGLFVIKTQTHLFLVEHNTWFSEFCNYLVQDKVKYTPETYQQKLEKLLSSV